MSATRTARPLATENAGIETTTGDPPGRPRLIATDFFSLYRPSECDLRVWLRAQDVEEAAPGPYSQVLMKLGTEHERRHLARFPNHVDLGRLPIDERAERTRELVAENERVIYQGALQAETTLAGTEVEIVGVPDFLLPARSGYAIRDSKLARRVGGGRYPAIELQLATYGWLYEQTFGEAPVALQVHSGAGVIVDIPYEGGEAALETLERILSDRLADEEPAEPVAWGKCASCGFFDRCWPRAVERRSVGLLPWAGTGLIGELERRGTETIDQLLENYDAEASRGSLHGGDPARVRRVEPESGDDLAGEIVPWSGRRTLVQPPPARDLTVAGDDDLLADGRIRQLGRRLPVGMDRRLAAGEPVVDDHFLEGAEEEEHLVG